MTNIKALDMRHIEKVLDMGNGYVLDFTNRSFADFFFSELDIAIDDPIYQINGTSKANRLRAFLTREGDLVAARALRKLWTYREATRPQDEYETDVIRSRYFEIIARLEESIDVPRTDALVRFDRSETVTELVAAIERDIDAGKPAAALDRLHTYTMKMFGHLLTSRGIFFDKEDALHTRVGKYVKAVEGERSLSEMSLRILKSGISIFDRYNEVRNNRSFAHDNDITDPAEARFIFESVSAILRFVSATDARALAA